MRITREEMLVAAGRSAGGETSRDGASLQARRRSNPGGDSAWHRATADGESAGGERGQAGGCEIGGFWRRPGRGRWAGPGPDEAPAVEDEGSEVDGGGSAAREQ